MNIEQRINAFVRLGKRLRELSTEEFTTLAGQAACENPWFTPQNIKMALDAIAEMLGDYNLREWTSAYHLTGDGRTIAVVMAGNIPLVGFHDFLAVLISGNSILIKVSSKDSVLIKYVIQVLTDIEPEFKSKIVFTERLKNFDAIIATGSDNTARYFEYYFAKYPHIIRKNRTSCAILTGDETAEEFDGLGKDIFSYFGLGCRNVSKIFVPSGYDFSLLFESFDPHQHVGNHHKYRNNYDYQKSIMLVNLVPFLDNGFVMLTESEKTVSPISVVFYEYYSDEKDLQDKLLSVNDKLQCIVGRNYPATTPFGKAQYPALYDYADKIDTLIFLSALEGEQ